MTTQIRYKLTDADMKSNSSTFQWKIREWYSVKVKPELCSNGFHCYQHPLLAVLHNPIHSNYCEGMRLWKCEVSGRSETEGQMKECWRKMRLVEEIPVPVITANQRIIYAILCAKQVCNNTNWNVWADNWLSGKDRSAEAAKAAKAASAAEAVVWAVEWAADAAMATEAAMATGAAKAAWAVAWAVAWAAKAAWAAAEAAEAAEVAKAAWAVAWADKPIDLIVLAERAIAEEKS